MLGDILDKDITPPCQKKKGTKMQKTWHWTDCEKDACLHENWNQEAGSQKKKKKQGANRSTS